jgi:leucyl aminopeptidase
VSLPSVFRSLALLFGAFALGHAGPAAAQRDIAFEPYAVPDTGALVIAVRQGAPREGVYAAVDEKTGGALARAVATAGYTAERGAMLNLPGVGPYAQVVLVGIGADTPSPRLLEDIGGLAGQAGVISAAPRIDVLWPDTGTANAGAHIAFGTSLGQYTFRIYRTPKPEAPVLGKGSLVVRVADAEGAARAWDADWRHVADSIRFARDLVTEPGNSIYPESFVERASAAFEGVRGVRIEVLDEKDMARLGMRSILAVGMGSARPPRLFVVRYAGGQDGEAPIAFVGKGITFDTGGISLKPNENMWRMKYDMTGAASSVGAVLALARRGAKVNAIAVAALAENMPSGTAARPGDVVRTASGKTYEVMSTDAEGRMVLVDALWYVQTRDRPAKIIDIATLTGSQVTALGDEYAGLFTWDDAFAARLVESGRASGEEVWRLPLHTSYAKDLESPIADLRHTGSSGRAGASLGAYFIGQWIEPGVAWAHLDIASMAWRDDLPLPTVPLGATAYGVRLFDRYVRDHVEAVGR